jgi:hypothetical protein
VKTWQAECLPHLVREGGAGAFACEPFAMATDKTFFGHYVAIILSTECNLGSGIMKSGICVA